MKNYQETKDILRVQEVKAKRYGIIPKLVMQDTRISIESKAIYSYFCSYAGNGDTTFPSINKICTDLCISDERFRKHFKLLKDYGYITVEQNKEKGKFSHNIYTLIDKPTHKIPYPENPYPEKLGTNINKDFKNNRFSKINMVMKNITHREDIKAVCDTSISDLKSHIKTITGFDISEGKIIELIMASSVERIQYHLNNWHIHKKNQVKSGAGYFITVVHNNIEPIEPERKIYIQNKIAHRNNFDQREYTDEQLERFYCDLSK